MTKKLTSQAEKLFSIFSELVRRYQFRDREEICCHGLSVSQCYTLEYLLGNEPMTMGELAGILHLEISTMTRVIDNLVSSKLVSRSADPKDRRLCRVKITAKGETLISKVRADLIEQHAQILKKISPDSRKDVISALSELLEAFKERRQKRDKNGGCC